MNPAADGDGDADMPNSSTTSVVLDLCPTEDSKAESKHWCTGGLKVQSEFGLRIAY